MRAIFGYMECPTLAPILALCEGESLDLDKPDDVVRLREPARGARLARRAAALATRPIRVAAAQLAILATELEIPANRRVELSVEAAV